jgi:hypothetical protein
MPLRVNGLWRTPARKLYSNEPELAAEPGVARPALLVAVRELAVGLNVFTSVEILIKIHSVQWPESHRPPAQNKPCRASCSSSTAEQHAKGTMTDSMQTRHDGRKGS